MESNVSLTQDSLWQLTNNLWKLLHQCGWKAIKQAADLLHLWLLHLISQRAMKADCFSFINVMRRAHNQTDCFVRELNAILRNGSSDHVMLWCCEFHFTAHIPVPEEQSGWAECYQASTGSEPQARRLQQPQKMNSKVVEVCQSLLRIYITHNTSNQSLD